MATSSSPSSARPRGSSWTTTASSSARRGSELFTNYLNLLKKIDSFVAGVMARHPDSFRCAPGCCKCCVAGITVWRVEADHISAKTGLGIRDSGFGSKNRFSEFRVPNPESRENACTHLGKDNLCSIYDARPVVCRMWGAPLLIPKGREAEWGLRPAASATMGSHIVTCCDLNFADGERLEDLADSDILNAETAITALAAINHVYCRSAGASPEERVPLCAIA